MKMLHKAVVEEFAMTTTCSLKSSMKASLLAFSYSNALFPHFCCSDLLWQKPMLKNKTKICLLLNKLVRRATHCTWYELYSCSSVLFNYSKLQA